MKQTGKMSQSGCFITIQVIKSGHFVTATYVHLQGWVDKKSLDVLSGVEMSQYVDVVNPWMMLWVDVSWVLKCY